MTLRQKIARLHVGGVQLIGIALGCARPLHAGAADAASVLARMRQAAVTSALDGHGVEFIIRGRTNRYESPGPYSIRFAPSGEFVFHVEGPLAETVGFDGRACWAVDMTGMPRSLELLDRDYHLLQIGLSTGQWLAHVDVADVTLAPDHSDPNTVVLAVRHGRFQGKLRVNGQNWLPVAFERTGVTGRETWVFADYRAELGWKLPGKVTVRREGSTDDICHVQSVSQVPSASSTRRHFEPIAARPRDARFNSTVSPRLDARRAPTGHMLVHPRVDNVDLGWFIFDTGAGSSAVLDPSALARLKPERLGSRSITSMMGTVRTSIMRAHTLEIGPMTLEKPFLVEMDLGFVRRAMGEEVVGIIGYDLLSRCVTELALADDSISIHEPNGYHRDSAPWERLVLNQALPTVEATFEGNRRGRFRIDVGAAGAAGTVLFHSPAVESMELLKGRTVTSAQAGQHRIALGKIAWFELAGHRFENPMVLFALDRKGPMGDEYVDGNLGVEMLKPFRIVLDYPHERMAFIRRQPERR
jgi:hypothetical protein